MMKAQVYVKSDDDNTSILVSGNGNMYYLDVMDIPELTGIQRGVSFVKHQLQVEETEIYPDKLNIDDVLKDAYIRYCNINPVEGKTPDAKMLKFCETQLQIHNRWLCRAVNQQTL